MLVRALEVAALVALGVMAFEAMKTLSPAAHQRVATVRTDLSLDSAIVRSVERSVAPGPVIVEVRPPGFGPSHGYYTIDYWGIGWELVADGWRPPCRAKSRGIWNRPWFGCESARCRRR